MSQVKLVDWKYLKTVLLIPYSRQHWTRLSESEYSDVPASVPIGKHRTAWALHEVEAWLQKKLQQRDEHTP